MLSQESEWCSLFTFVYTCFTFKDCQGSHGHKLSTTKILLIWNNPCIHVYVWAWYSAVSNWQKIFNDEYFYSKKLTELYRFLNEQTRKKPLSIFDFKINCYVFSPLSYILPIIPKCQFCVQRKRNDQTILIKSMPTIFLDIQQKFEQSQYQNLSSTRAHQ